jgi:hypothetical protein
MIDFFRFPLGGGLRLRAGGVTKLCVDAVLSDSSSVVAVDAKMEAAGSKENRCSEQLSLVLESKNEDATRFNVSGPQQGFTTI